MYVKDNSYTQYLKIQDGDVTSQSLGGPESLARSWSLHTLKLSNTGLIPALTSFFLETRMNRLKNNKMYIKTKIL